MTTRHALLGTALASFALSALALPANAQVFVRNSTDVPEQGIGSMRYKENVDFADVDLDGDWDAAFALGGDLGNLQDRIWINQGGLQSGTTGVFSDETASRFPAIARTGRDIEFVDIDNDGDFDLYVANTSTIVNQGDQWLVNQGGVQGRTLGFFIDETASRWLNLGVAGPAGSSIAPTHLIGGTFIDWSGDGDFADLDNDGDMDLVHSSYGPVFSGQVPTRIFLNNGSGQFEEFNPSGFQLTGASISNGDPGLWCEGTQSADTSDTTGANCDIASSATDIDLGDIDGDFDLDILHGSLFSPPRFFENRLAENGGMPDDLGFRDVSSAVFPTDWAIGSGHYEQELGDFDGDNDLDLLGIDWQITTSGGPPFHFDNTVMANTGGVFGPFTILAGSSSDENEGDFGDYDNDGDLDLYIASFFATDRLYANNGSGAFEPVSDSADGSGLTELGGLLNTSSWDADWSDVDGDGDYDVFSAQDNLNPVLYWQNQTGTPDTTAPRVAPTEVLGNLVAGISGSADLPVRTHVYDNAPYYVTWYNPTQLVVEVDGIRVDKLPARSSGGQVFRAELPSNLVGEVTYRFESKDKYGNQGVSGDTTYTASTPLTLETTYGSGTVGSTGQLHELHARGLATGGKNLYLSIETNNVPTAYVMTISLGSIAPTPIDDLGLLNIDPFQIVLQRAGVTNANGVKVRKLAILPGTPNGFSVYAQVFGVDGVGGYTFSSSRGLEIPFH